MNTTFPSNQQTYGTGITGLILGAIGLLVCWIPILGWAGLPIALLGAVLSLLALFKGGDNIAYGLAGLLLNGLSLIVFAISALFLVAFFGVAGVAINAADQANQKAIENQPAAVEPETTK